MISNTILVAPDSKEKRGQYEDHLVRTFQLNSVRAKEMADILKALKINDLTCLIGTAGLQPVVYKSARNIRGVEIRPAAEFNAYCVLRPKRLLLTKAALQQLRDKGKA